MKNFSLITTIAMISAMALSSVASASTMVVAPTTREVQLGISDAFVPSGFDSNSDANVIVSGWFPNSCYSWGHDSVATENTGTINVKSYANVTSGMCMMIMMPFQRQVDLGKLAVGNHTIHFLNGDGTYLEKTLNIE